MHRFLMPAVRNVFFLEYQERKRIRLDVVQEKTARPILVPYHPNLHCGTHSEGLNRGSQRRRWDQGVEFVWWAAVVHDGMLIYCTSTTWRSVVGKERMCWESLVGDIVKQMSILIGFHYGLEINTWRTRTFSQTRTQQRRNECGFVIWTRLN